MSAVLLDQHLESCTDCARWLESATRVTRQLRLGLPAAPDLTPAITSDVVLPARRVLRRRFTLRITLFVIGLIQLAIAVPALVGDSVGMAMSEHATHEAAAWNLAIAVAFLAAASRPRRAAGLIPLLGAFVVVLAGLSIYDIASGAATWNRIFTHFAAVLGLLVLLWLDRAERALPPLRSGAIDGSESLGDGGNTRIRGVA